MMLAMHVRPSSLLGIEHSYDAWCVDQAIWLVISTIRNGGKLKNPKTKDNHALLKKMGVK